ANAAVAAADVVLVVGSKLSPSDTANENPALLDPIRQRLVQIDVEPLNIGWTFPVTLGLVGDASAVLADLTERLGAGDGRSAGANRVAALRQEHGWFDSPELLDDALPLLPQRVIRVLNETLPDDAIVCGDAGENRIFLTHHFRTTASGGFIQSSGVGAMVYALPAAMAVKLVHPDRMAVAFCGDGGFALGMNGLLTAVEEKIPVVVVVMNNSALGWVLHGQRQRPIASRFGDFDLAAISRAMGCDARRVTTSDELREALDAARDVRVPTVIEVLVSLDQSYEDVTSPLMK
ncbi:MAG: hypothetical protein JWN99_2938, partial [Ilumatobacteraceae bacterium]|nr:hypothetical protein [Ilumatobacteraceae bacterium]